jgi:electron transfer flavoprotein alpha/beta subunit
LNPQNGIVFEPTQLATALYQLLRKSEQELIDMGKKGHQIGSEATPQRWAKTLLNLVSL